MGLPNPIPNMAQRELKFTFNYFVDDFLLGNAEPDELEKDDPRPSVSVAQTIIGADFPGGYLLDGPKRLAASLIGDAIDTLTAPETKTNPKDSTDRREDRWWILYDGFAPYSFRWCCALLGMNAENIRQQVFTAMNEGRYIRGRLRGGPDGDNPVHFGATPVMKASAKRKDLNDLEEPKDESPPEDNVFESEPPNDEMLEDADVDPDDDFDVNIDDDDFEEFDD